MNLGLLGLACAVALVTSALLTWMVRIYALRSAVIDVPNERSSHSQPTARGGGLAICVVVLGGIALSGWLGILPGSVVMAALGGILVAGVGWLDDHAEVPARVRVAVHFAAAGWALWWLGGLPFLAVGGTRIHLGAMGTVLALLGIVWGVNLYNFMDGIDGIAGGEALSAGLFGGLLLLQAGNVGLATYSLLLAAASGGFLYWNWAPARIFMGDVGSGLIGYLFVVMAIASEGAGALPLLSWSLLLGVFLFDATVTLLRRLLRGERLHMAHRSHAYQRAVQAGWTHAQVTTAVLLTNGALALLAYLGWRMPGLLTVSLGAGASLLTVLYLMVERHFPMAGQKNSPAQTRSSAPAPSERTKSSTLLG